MSRRRWINIVFIGISILIISTIPSLNSFAQTGSPTPTPTLPIISRPTNTPSPTTLPPPPSPTPTATNPPPAVAPTEPIGEITIPSPTPTLPVFTVPDTPTPPKFSLIPFTPTPPVFIGPEVPDISVYAVEISQGLQDFENRMPLVEGRWTIARVYVKTDAGDWPNLKGVMEAWRGGQKLGSAIPAHNQPTTVHGNGGDRLDIDDSLYFFIPQNWRSGLVTFKFFVYAGSVNAPFTEESEAENNFFDVAVEFHPAAPLHVAMVPMHTHIFVDGVALSTLEFYLSYFGAQDVYRDMFRLHPISELYVYETDPLKPAYHSNHELDWNPTQEGVVWSMLDRLAWLNAKTEDWVEGLVWYGMVHPDIPMLFYPSDEDLDPFPIGGMSNGQEAYGKMDSQPSGSTPWSIGGGEAMGHEMGHSKGLGHVKCVGDEEKGGPVDEGFPWPAPNCSLAEVDPEGFFGLDVYFSLWGHLSAPNVISNDPGVSQPNMGKPLMGYDWPLYPDAYHYCKLLIAYGVPCDFADLGIGAVPPESQSINIQWNLPVNFPGIYYLQQENTTEYVFISGIIHKQDKTAEFSQVMRTSDPPEDALSAAEDKRSIYQAELLFAEYSISLESTSGEVLHSQGLVDTTSFHTPASTLGFFELLPYHPDTATIRIHEGNRLLAEQSVSTNPPEVTVLAPNGGETINAPFEIRWEAFDADGDLLNYTVQYSPDGGESWRALSVGQLETHLTLSTLATIPGSEHGLIRVIAADGVNSGQDISDSVFTVPDNPPSPVVIGPAEGSAFPLGVQVAFLGTATDPEDGTLPGATFQWISDRDGLLGNGTEIITSGLSAGPHKISLTVTDSRGQTSQAQVRITIDGSITRERPNADELEMAERFLAGERTAENPAGSESADSSMDRLILLLVILSLLALIAIIFFSYIIRQLNFRSKKRS